MSATLIVRHTVADYATWREAYESAETVRAKYGCTDQQVLRVPSDPNDVAATHEFPSVEQAEAFAADPDLRAAMERGGVTAAPRIEIFQNV
jgi:hypothetical protein